MKHEILDHFYAISGTVLTAILAFFSKKYKSKIIKYFERNKISSLTQHRFFTECVTVKEDMDRVNFTTHKEFDKVKTKMMLKIVELKCEAFKEEFEKLILNKEINKWSANKLQQEIAKAYSTVLKKYNKGSERVFKDWGISEEDAKFLIEKYEEYRSNVIKTVSEGINDVVLNKDYKTNYIKVSVFLDLACMAVTLTPSSVRETFEAVNGRFAKYKNLIM